MNEPTSQSPLASPHGSSLVNLPEHLKEEIGKLLRAAWRDGFESGDDCQIDFFDGFAVARELLSEPRRVCCECSSRLCDGEEDEMCRQCWDASIARANANREALIAAGWIAGHGGGLVPPIRKASRGYTIDAAWAESSGLIPPNASAEPRPEGTV